MYTPLVLLLLSLASAGGAYSLNGDALTLPLAVSLLAAIAAVFLVAKALLHRPKGETAAPKRKLRRPRKNDPHVVIDGSNVMHWNGQAPHLATLKEVIAELRALGCQPGVIFDANAGYKLKNRYLDDRHFAKLLKLPQDRVLVVPKGEPADSTILAAARELKAKVITNDRFRDWMSDFPEVASSGHLVKGGYRAGKPWFDEAALTRVA